MHNSQTFSQCSFPQLPYWRVPLFNMSVTSSERRAFSTIPSSQTGPSSALCGPAFWSPMYPSITYGTNELFNLQTPWFRDTLLQHFKNGQHSLALCFLSVTDTVHASTTPFSPEALGNQNSSSFTRSTDAGARRNTISSASRFEIAP